MTFAPISAFGDEIASDLDEQVGVLEEQSVGAIELRSAWGVNVVDFDAEQLERVAATLAATRFAVSAIASPVGKAPVDGDLDEELARLRAAMGAAKQLGTPRIRVFSFFVPEGTQAGHRDEVMRRMSAFAREAAAQDLVLVHENESYIYGDDAERCRDLVESVGSRALQLAFDPANFVQVGVRPYDQAWPLLAEHVVHFHVKDAVAGEAGMAGVRPAGEGDGQLAELMGALQRQDYRGFLVIEPHLHMHLPDMSGAERFGVAVTALRRLL
jgi:sugar phosphate isomerase/epimerase